MLWKGHHGFNTLWPAIGVEQYDLIFENRVGPHRSRNGTLLRSDTPPGLERPTWFASARQPPASDRRCGARV